MQSRVYVTVGYPTVLSVYLAGLLLSALHAEILIDSWHVAHVLSSKWW